MTGRVRILEAWRLEIHRPCWTRVGDLRLWRLALGSTHRNVLLHWDLLWFWVCSFHRIFRKTVRSAGTRKHIRLYPKLGIQIKQAWWCNFLQPDSWLFCSVHTCSTNITSFYDKVPESVIIFSVFWICSLVSNVSRVTELVQVLLGPAFDAFATYAHNQNCWV